MAFDYAKAYQQFIDEELVAASATAWMIPEAGKVRFTGGVKHGCAHCVISPSPSSIHIVIAVRLSRSLC